MKSILLGVCMLVSAFPILADPATDADIVGLYENRSESSFVFTLKLASGGKATYTEPDLEGGGKPFVRAGKWVLSANRLDIDLQKEGRYTYLVQDVLSYSSFGCKGGSFGLAIQATPKGASKDSRYDVWRKADLKKVRC